MSAMTYEHPAPRRRIGVHPKQIATDIGEAVLSWLGRVGERSANGRAAAEFRRLNALTDAQLARMDMKRGNLLERCYGWRAYY